jgi:hypothetical protein
MKTMIGIVTALSVSAVSTIAFSTPSSAQVIVNNVFSPFSSTVIGPGYGYYSYSDPYRSGYYERPNSYYSEPNYYSRPGYYESSGYYRQSHYDRRYNARQGHCWIYTDRDRNYGYWGRCR